MSELSINNINLGAASSDSSLKGSARFIKRLETAQKLQMQKLASGRKHDSYTEMSLDSTEQTVELASQLSDLTSNRRLILRANSDLRDMSDGLRAIIKLTQNFKITLLQFESQADQSLNKNAMQKAAKEFSASLQYLLNTKSSLGNNYIFSGQKIQMTPVDLSQDVDNYYKGSEFNREILLDNHSVELPFKANDESIKDLVKAKDLITKGLQTGFGRMIQLVDQSLSQLISSKFQLDIQQKYFVTRADQIEIEYSELNDRFNEMSDTDQTQLLIDLQKTKTQLNAIGASQKYVNFEMANYL